LGERLAGYIGRYAAEQGHYESDDCYQDYYRDAAAHDAVLLGFVEAFEFAHRVVDNLAGLCSCGFTFGLLLGPRALRWGCLSGFSCWLFGDIGVVCGACGSLRGLCGCFAYSG